MPGNLKTRKMKKIILLLIAGIVLSNNYILGQEEDNTSKKKYTKQVLLTPQYVGLHGIRIDFEFMVGPKNALVIAPRVHLNTDGSSNIDYEQLVALGGNFAYKLNFREPAGYKMNPYMAFGAYYTWYNITLEQSAWVDYYIDDLPALTLDGSDKDFQIHKMGPEILVGFQLLPIPEFVIDISVGAGLRYSISGDDEELINDKFNNSIIDPAFTGILPVFNLKLGYRF